jgi:hypothetical protein
MNQHAYLRLGLINLCVDRPAPVDIGPRPEIPGDGGKVRIFEKGLERGQLIHYEPNQYWPLINADNYQWPIDRSLRSRLRIGAT